MPLPKDPDKAAAYRAKMREHALRNGLGKDRKGKPGRTVTPEEVARRLATGRAKWDDPEWRQAASKRAKAAGSGTWMKGKTDSPETAAKKGEHTRGKTYDDIYGERAATEREVRTTSNRKRWDAVPRKPQRPKHNCDYRYKEWRRAVFQRDDFTCRKCGKRGGRLNAHHMLWWSTHPDHRYNVANGRTLCQPCHKAYPRYPRP